MGTIRLLLAFIVVAGHTVGSLGIGADHAVQFFFVVSGYLISLILQQETAYKEKRRFYLNRLLRIFPLYGVALLCTVVVNLALVSAGKSSVLFSAIQQLPFEGQVFAVLANLGIIGQASFLFLGLNDGTLNFAIDFHQSNPELWQAMAIPPAWSLDLELCFYLIAPFILRSKKLLLATFAFGVVTKVALICLGLGSSDPWSHRFFPSELSTFLLGSLAQRYVAPKLKSFHWVKTRVARIAVMIGVIFGVFGYSSVHLPELLKLYIALAAFALVLPILAEIQHQSPADYVLGKFSFPVYVWHWVVIGALSYFGLEPFGESSWMVFGLVSVITGLISFASMQLLEKRVDLFRDNVRNPLRRLY